MTRALLLRAPARDEAEALARFGAACFVDTFGHLYAPEDLQIFLRENHGTECIAAALRDPATHYAVLEDGEAWLGYCRIGPVSLPVPNPACSAMELKQLYLMPKAQNRGLAGKLMDWALAAMREHGARDVYLSVWSENHRAQRFYQRYGFAQIGSFDFMVGRHADLEWLYHARLD